ncbi:polyketide cyclase [Streptomyces sp. NPDC018947]|uniref:polyketide cyclase n=1 Tax=Streptomyces sp. NPDC018947 TaxID=3365054 RepID=UPI0037B7DF01
MSATLVVAAPAATVFAVLADPAAHRAIDGTGWVREAVDPAPLTEAGQIFRMAMYHPGHPDGDYRTVNKVQVFDPPRALAWLTGRELDDGRFEFGGWLWRYDLVPLGPAGTEVTLTYDWSAVPRFVRERGIRFPPFGPDHLTDSLHHLARLATGHPGTPSAQPWRPPTALTPAYRLPRPASGADRGRGSPPNGRTRGGGVAREGVHTIE